MGTAVESGKWKVEVRTARKRRKPVRCWFSGKKVLSCEQESAKQGSSFEALILVFSFHLELFTFYLCPVEVQP